MKFFKDNGRTDLAEIYEEITELSCELAKIIPQDFSAAELFSDKEKLKPFCDVLSKIYDLEKQAAISIE